MVNIRKLHERWDRQDARRKVWWDSLSKEQKEDHEQQEEEKVDAWMTARTAANKNLSDPRLNMTAMESAHYDREHEIKGSLAWHLADAEIEGDIWCSLDGDVFAEQERQAKMRKRYGKAWSGLVKLGRFHERDSNGKKPYAWKVIRWLEKRGFVKVGNGYVKWVGSLE